jgi:hypothetical protein
LIAHYIITALLSFAPCGSQAAVLAQHVAKEEPFVYSYQTQRLAKEMSLVVAGVPAELERIQNYFQITRKFLGEIYFCEDEEAFASKLQFEPPTWYNAVAQPGLKQIVVFVKPRQSPAQIAKLLNHELVHWSLFQLPAQARRQIPLWLHEGLAEMWSDRGLAEAYQVSLAWESKHNSLPRLSSFATEFGDEPYRAAVGYALSKEFVIHLVGDSGDALFIKIFNSMEAGRSFDQALVDHTGLSVVSHEKIVRANLNSWWRVVQEMYPHFFLLLVLIMLGLVPFVASRRRHHREALHAVWQSEEDEVEMLAGHDDNISDE